MDFRLWVSLRSGLVFQRNAWFDSGYIFVGFAGDDTVRAVFPSVFEMRGIMAGMAQKDSLRCRFGCYSCSRCPHVENGYYSLPLDKAVTCSVLVA